MIQFDGVCLMADGWAELHEFARQIGVSRSWFGFEPVPHYDIICPFRAKIIFNYIERKERKQWQQKLGYTISPQRAMF